MSSTLQTNKTIIKNTGMLYMRMVFALIVSLYTSRIILKIIGVVDFGLYNVILSVVSSFTFINMAMSSSTKRFLTFELGKEDQTKLNRIFSATVSIHIGIAILTIILAETIGLWFLYNQLNIPNDRFSVTLWVYQIIIFTAVVTIIQVPYFVSIISHEKMSVFAFFSSIEVSINLLLVYLLTFISFDKLVLYAILIFIIKLGVAVSYRFYCRMHFPETRYQFYYDKELFKELIAYSGWNLFGNFSAIARVQGVNILLNIFFGPIVNASRAIAFQVQNAVNSFVQNIQTSTSPQIIKSYAIGDQKYMLNLIYSSTKFSYFIIFLISLPLLLETRFILNLWLVDIPEFAIIFTFLILINTLIESISSSLMTAFHATGKIKKYQVIVGSLVLLNLPLSYLLLKLGYAPETTIYVSIILSIVALFTRLSLLNKLINITFYSFSKNVFQKLLIVTLISLILPIFISFLFEYGLKRFLIVTISSITSVVISIYIFGLNQQERLFIINKIKKK